ncbi:DUF6279 family lipoprotein [Aliiglaciecola sp. SL4]|uniref:DUF6279 family lipoprotein n=1 Tax=Aliiglaciecola sp. SL4 TaxID=3239806 RepID=UPI00355C11B3
MKFTPLFVSVCLAAILLLGGCTSKFAYNNIDWMMYWYVDDYVDLDKSQKVLLDEKVEKWLKWHRQEELVTYRQHLADLKADLKNGNLTAQQWSKHIQRGSDHWTRFRNQISPELAELSIHLNDTQIQEMFDALEKENQKKEQKRNKKSAEERWENAIEDTQDQIKKWVGKLSKSQKDLIAEYTVKFLPTFEGWIDYRRNFQASVKNIMLSRHDVSNYAEEVDYMFQHPVLFKTPEYQQASEHNRKMYIQLLLELQTTFSEKQTKHILNELDDLIDDIDDLIDD